jgi:hypothetical protein
MLYDIYCTIKPQPAGRQEELIHNLELNRVGGGFSGQEGLGQTRRLGGI